MHYYIDGYNLMFRVLRAGDELQVRREKIIHDLNQKVQFLELDATLVFDAHYHYGEASRTHFNHLEILFTSEGESADELILHELKSERIPGEHTVVTSDKKLAWLARRKHAKTESVEEFLDWVNRRYKNKIRRIKNPKESLKEQELKIIEKLKSSEPPKPPGKPASASTPAECFDYYLDAFEKRVLEQWTEVQPDINVVQETLKPRKLKKHTTKDEDEHLSDMQRWLKAFEKELGE